MMQHAQIDDLGFCPSFSCYSSDCLASTAAARISNQLLQQQHEARFRNVDDEEFEFSLMIGDEAVSPEDTDSDGQKVFPLFNRDLLIQNKVDRDPERGKLEEEEIACTTSLEKLFISERDKYSSSSSSSFVRIGNEVISPEVIDSDGRTVSPLFNRDLLIQNEVDLDNERGKLEGEEIVCSGSLEKLFINERDESVSSSSSSSSESDESETEAPGVFCVWRHKTETKTDAGTISSPLSKCKKSSSTGSGSKRWRIRDLLRRSNSEGKEPMVLLTQKKVETPKRKLNSGDVFPVTGKLKASSPSIHEVFYVQQRAKREVVKRKSYLPYRQGLVGFFSNGNSNSNTNGGKMKKLPF